MPSPLQDIWDLEKEIASDQTNIERYSKRMKASHEKREYMPKILVVDCKSCPFERTKVNTED